jgi:FtsH-binding integral membrane protein
MEKTADTGLVEVRQNRRLAKFLRRIYSGTVVGVLTAGVTAAVAAPIAIRHPLAACLGGFGVGLFALFRIMKENPIPLGPGVTDNTRSRKMAMYTFFASQGVVMSPLVALIGSMAPGTLLPAFLLSTATVAGSSFWAMSRPTGSLLSWGAPLSGGK